MGTRDDMCGIDVARMAELGGFAEEITIIGCVYKQDGDVLYRVTDDPDEAYHFFFQLADDFADTLVRRVKFQTGFGDRMILRQSQKIFQMFRTHSRTSNLITAFM